MPPVPGVARLLLAIALSVSTHGLGLERESVPVLGSEFMITTQTDASSHALSGLENYNGNEIIYLLHNPQQVFVKLMLPFNISQETFIYYVIRKRGQYKYHCCIHHTKEKCHVINECPLNPYAQLLCTLLIV